MKYTERDSFLFGLTLTELTFVIFMIFLLFFMNHLHEKQLEIDKQAEQNEKLIVEINAQKEKVKFYEDKNEKREKHAEISVDIELHQVATPHSLL